MIFVTTGTCEPFDRLLRAVDALELDEPIVAQCGASAVRPRGAACFDFLPFDEVKRYVEEARVVITHGGVGSVLVAISAGRRPIVVPRSPQHGDAVDDHQLPFARRMHEAGRIVLLSDLRDLAEALSSQVSTVARVDVGGGALVSDLRAYLSAAIPAAAAGG